MKALGISAHIRNSWGFKGKALGVVVTCNLVICRVAGEFLVDAELAKVVEEDFLGIT